jgi:hypothetical protein
MAKSKYIGNTNCIRCGTMICDNCHKPIDGKNEKYLIVDIFDPSKRGNEHDTTKIYHRQCSSDDTTWKRHDDDLKREKEKENNLLIKVKHKAIELINNANWIYIDENEDIIVITIGK